MTTPAPLEDFNCSFRVPEHNTFIVPRTQSHIDNDAKLRAFRDHDLQEGLKKLEGHPPAAGHFYHCSVPRLGLETDILIMQIFDHGETTALISDTAIATSCLFDIYLKPQAMMGPRLINLYGGLVFPVTALEHMPRIGFMEKFRFARVHTALLAFASGHIVVSPAEQATVSFQQRMQLVTGRAKHLEDYLHELVGK